MTHAELRAAAQYVVARGDSGGGYVLTLVLPGEGTGATRRLAGRSGPRGEVLCINSEGNTACAFDARKVLSWLDTLGAST